MQFVEVFNARAYATAIAGLGRISAESRRDGSINTIVFDDNFIAYSTRCALSGILVRDKAGLYTPTGYQLIVAVDTVLDPSRFICLTSASANYVATLPAAADVPANEVRYFYFESGAHNVDMTAAGLDTIDGDTDPHTMTLAAPVLRLVSDGVSAWTSV